MKNFSRFLGLGFALMLAIFAGVVRAQEYSPDTIDDQTGASANAPPAAGAPSDDSSVSFQQFYDQLADQGTWINTDKYGYVFQPTETNADWAPYTYGHWVNTADGLTWVSDDSFGWATDHYGRWANLDGTGWVWVPGYTWAPAWVSWREGDDDVGWAPLPPDTDLGVDYYGDDYADWGFGFHIGDDCDLAYGIGPWCYNFCPIAYIGDRDGWRHYHHRGDNFGLIGRTRNVTNLNFTRNGAGRFGHVRAGGPSVATLNSRAQTPIQNARLAHASTLDNAGLRGNTLSVFAPHVNPATRGTARPDVVSRTVANASVNHGTDINRGFAVNSHLGATAATSAQVHAATASRTAGFANARVATDSTHFTRDFGGSLNTLRTEPRTSAVFSAGSARTSSIRSSTPSISTEPRITGEAVPRSNEPTRSGSAFAGGSQGRVFDTRTTRVYGNGTTDYEPGSYQGAPAFHSYTPTARSYSPAYGSYSPSYHSSYGGSSFRASSTPSYRGGGFSHAASGGFSGGGRASSGGFSGGGHVSSSGGGGGFSGGGGRGGGGGHR